MSEEPFLRAILATPGDATVRLLYADWLDEQGQSEKAQFLRLDAEELQRLRRPAPNGPPHWERPLNCWWFHYGRHIRAAKHIHRRVCGDWIAFLETLGRPPFACKFSAREFQTLKLFTSDQYPFAQPLVSRGALTTFDGQFRAPVRWSPGLMDEAKRLRFLARALRGSGLGIATPWPFLFELPLGIGPLVESDVRAAFQVRASEASSSWLPPRSRYVLELHQVAEVPDVADPPRTAATLTLEQAQRMTLVDLASATKLVGRPADRAYRGEVFWFGRLTSRSESARLHRPEISLWFAATRSRHGDHLLGLMTHDLGWRFASTGYSR